MFENKISSENNVLVLDGNQRSSLAVVRSLGKLNVNIITSDDNIASLAGKSKFSSKYIQSPSAKDNPTEFINWFKDIINSENISIAFPITEITSQLLLINLDQYSDKVKLPFADIDTVMQLADKSKLMKLAQKLGVKHPATQYFQHLDELDLNTIDKFPIVLKPSQSRFFLGNEWLYTEVKIFYSRDELDSFVSKNIAYLKYPFMLQEFIPGSGAGIFAIYDNGIGKAFFAHKRIREKPPTGGVSVLSESVELESEMLSAAQKILDEVKWHGVAMVEFRVDANGIPYLMEVNTRFWGSLQLAIDSGVDFPKMLYNITQDIDTETVTSYKTGQQLRWLLGDIDSMYILIKSRNFTITKKMKTILCFLCPKFTKRRMEVNRMDDFLPAVYEFKQYIKSLF